MCWINLLAFEAKPLHALMPLCFHYESPKNIENMRIVFMIFDLIASNHVTCHNWSMLACDRIYGLKGKDDLDVTPLVPTTLNFNLPIRLINHLLEKLDGLVYIHDLEKWGGQCE